MNVADRADPILEEPTACDGDKKATANITKTSDHLVSSTRTSESLHTKIEIPKKTEITSRKKYLGFETSCPIISDTNSIEGQQMILPKNGEVKKRNAHFAGPADLIDQGTSSNMLNSATEAIIGVSTLVGGFTSTNVTVPVTADVFDAGNVAIGTTTNSFTSDSSAIPSILVPGNEVGAHVDAYVTTATAAPPTSLSFSTISATASNSANPEIPPTTRNVPSPHLPNVPNIMASTDGYVSSNGHSSAPENAPNSAPIHPFIRMNAPAYVPANTSNAVPMDAYVSTNISSSISGNTTVATAPLDVYVNNNLSASSEIGSNVVSMNSYISTNASSGTSGSASISAPIIAYTSTNAPSAASRNGPDAGSIVTYISTNTSSSAPANERNSPAPIDTYVLSNAPSAAVGNGSDSDPMGSFMTTNAPPTASLNGTNVSTAMHPYISRNTRNAAPDHDLTPTSMDRYGSSNALSTVSGNRPNITGPINAYVSGNSSSAASGNVSNAAQMDVYGRTNMPSRAPGNLPIVSVPMDSYVSTNAPSGASMNRPNLSMDGYVSASAPSTASGNACSSSPMDPYVSVDAGHTTPSNDAFAPINVATPTASGTDFSTSHMEAPVSFTPTNVSNSAVPVVSYTSNNVATHSAPSDAYTPISIGNQADTYAPVNASASAVTGGGYSTANVTTHVDLYNTSTNTVAPELKIVTDAFHSSSKKPRFSNSSVVEPMGELRPTDVLAGNYRKRPGNALYKTLLRQYAQEVGKIEMKTIVSKVFDTVSNQNPPGRFIREGGDALMSRAQTNQKIARALREVADRASAKLIEEGGEGLDLAFAGLGDRRLSKALSTPKGEPVGEIRQTDVLTGNYRKRTGNALYKKLLRENAPLLEKIETKVLVTRVIDGIANQEPPGRFIREGGTSLLTTGQIRQKVSRALKEVVDRSDRPEGLERPIKKARKSSMIIKSEEPIGEIRETDVLTGNYRKRRGNALYKALLRQNAPRVGNEEMKTVVKTVVDGIYQQEPPGRFIREGGGSMLSRGQVHQKVARALREVVDRTSGVIAALKPPEPHRKEVFNLSLKQNQGQIDYKRNISPGRKIEEQLLGTKFARESIGMQGQLIGLQRHSVGIQEASLGMQGQSIGMQGLSVGMQGQSVGMQGQSVGIQGLSVGMQGPSTVMQGLSVGMQGTSAVMQGLSVGMHGPSAVMQGLSIGMQGPSVGIQRHSVEIQGQSVGIQDHPIGMQDQSVQMQEEPMVVKMEEQPVNMKLESPEKEKQGETAEV